MKLHESITADLICDAVQAATFGLENPGFCAACGAEYDDCEPDTRKRSCDDCGACAVYGAEELLFHVGA